MALIGNTVILRAEFRDYDGQTMITPTNIKLTIYDSNKKKIDGPFDITAAHRIAEGIYEYPYVIPEGNSPIVFAFEGIGPDGKPVVSRAMISREWTR